LAYFKETLRYVSDAFCIDSRRIFCLGLSAGGRLCQRFVSDFHDITFAAVGVVSAVRYPYPNRNLRPVPMIAFHGVDDGMNHYWGGGPDYWGQESVPQAIEEWSHFNGCQHTSASEHTSGVVIYKHTQCTDGADIVLVSIRGGGHTYPMISSNAAQQTIRCGPHHLPVAYVNITQFVWQFFLEHGTVTDLTHSDFNFSATTDSLGFKGNLSSAASTSEDHLHVNGPEMQPSESADRAPQLLSMAQVSCMVLILISSITAAVSVGLFCYYQLTSDTASRRDGYTVTETAPQNLQPLSNP